MSDSTLYKQIVTYIDEHKDEYIQQLIKFCSQPSISAQDVGIEDMRKLLISEAGNMGISTRVLDSKTTPALYGEVKGEGGRQLLFYNHYDVQPPEPYELWVSPPFTPTIRDGRLYARGANDNKGNIAARFAAIKAILDVRGSLPITVKFLIDGEEETGSVSLSEIVKNNKDLLKVNWVIWEDTLKEIDAPLISLGSKGMCYIELKCKTANTDFHSAFAGVYPNAAWRLVSALSTIKSGDGKILIDGFYDDVRPFSEQEKVLLDEQPPVDLQKLKSLFEIEEFVNNVGPEKFRAQYVADPTCNLSGFQSGYTGKGAKTVIPAEASAKIDMRLVPNQTAQGVYEKVRKHLEARGFDDIEVILHHGTGAKPSISRIDNECLEALKEAISCNCKDAPVVEPLSSGATPMWIAAQLLDVPVLGYGLGHPSNRTHAPNESVVVEEFVNMIKIMAKFILNLG